MSPRRPLSLIAVVHTRRSPCRCHDFLLRELRELGFRAVDVAVEDLGASRGIIARSDLVFEHTDTFRGRGDLRPLVRHQIESWGGRLAGAPAAAAQAADDKIECRRRLEAAGLAVARGGVIEGLNHGGPILPRGLSYPVVLKRPFEHGSRGVALIGGPSALRETTRRWRRAGEGALLAEEIVDGKELALAVIERGGRPVALPAIEVRLPRGALYTRRRKWGAGPLPVAEASLESADRGRIEADAIRAFSVLGLRDYARFDVRLAPGAAAGGRRGGGRLRPIFLEANVRPSLEDGTELRSAARAAGIDDRSLVATILASAAARHGRGAVLDHVGGLARRLP
jgi:D-alanine-D-alanine ligase